MHTSFSVQSYVGVPEFSLEEENSQGTLCKNVDFFCQNKKEQLKGKIFIPSSMLREFRSGETGEWFFAHLDGVWSLVGFKKREQLHLEALEWRERTLNLRKQQTLSTPKSFDYLSLWVIPSFLGACFVSLLFYRLFPQNNVGLGLGLMTFSFMMSAALVYLNHWGLWKDIPELDFLEKEIKEKSSVAQRVIREVA